MYHQRIRCGSGEFGCEVRRGSTGTSEIRGGIDVCEDLAIQILASELDAFSMKGFMLLYSVKASRYMSEARKSNSESWLGEGFWFSVLLAQQRFASTLFGLWLATPRCTLDAL